MNHRTKQRLRFTACACLVLLSLVSTGFICVAVARSWPDILFASDFVSFWTGANLVRQAVGAGLYDMEIQRAFQIDLLMQGTANEELLAATEHNPFHSPPPLALIILPFTLLPMGHAFLLWFAGSLVTFIGVSVVALGSGARGPFRVLALLSFTGVTLSLVEGQVNHLFLFALALSMRLWSGGRRGLGGAVLGLMWLKPQYALPFVAVLVFKRRWSELLGMGATGAVVVGMSFLMVGADGLVRYMIVLSRIGEYYPPSSSQINPEVMVNWRGLLMALLPGMSSEVGSSLVLILAATTVAASMLLWRGAWNPSSFRFASQMLSLTMAAIIASPHSHYHGTVLILGPLGLLLTRLVSSPDLSAKVQHLAWLGYGLGLVVLPFRSWSWLFVPYSLVAMALLCRWCARQPEPGQETEYAGPVQSVSLPAS